MKKLLRILNVMLALAIILGCVSFGAGAETDHTEEIFTAVDRYYECSDIYVERAFFGEGEFVEMPFLCNYLKYEYRTVLNEYCITSKVDGYNRYTYEIPASVFEEMAFSTFAETEAITDALRGSAYYKTDRDEPYYSWEHLDVLLQGGQIHMIDHAGYREREDGLFEAWSYIADDTWRIDDGTGEYEYFTYVPDADDVLGEDYLMLPVRAFAIDTGLGHGFGYVPAKIFYAVRCVVEMGENGVKLHSFEQVDPTLVPDEPVPYTALDVNKLHNATMYTYADHFANGTKVYENSPSGGGIRTRAEIVLQGKAIYSVHEFTAMKNGEEVAPLKPVTVLFEIPKNVTEVELYKVYEEQREGDGHTYTEWKYEAVEATFDTEAYTATAFIDDFDGFYAVTLTRDGLPSTGILGDANIDGSINLSDAALMMKYIAKWEGLRIDILMADVNEDGVLNLTDVAKFLRAVNNYWSGYYTAGSK